MKLVPKSRPDGRVLFGVSRPDTIPGITRLAVLMSHRYGAEPVAVHVARGDAPTWEARVDLQGERLFEIARAEARTLGYPLRTYSEFAPDIARGIVKAAQDLEPYVLILGESAGSGSSRFATIADAIVDEVHFPLILTKFDACIQDGHVVAAVRDREELNRVVPLLEALEDGGCSTGVLERPTVESIRAASREFDLVVVSADDDPDQPVAAPGTLAGDLAVAGGVPMLLVCGDLRRSALRIPRR